MIGEELNISYTVEKSGDMVIPPLDLTVRYPHKSPQNNNLLYLTHVTTSPQVKCNTSRLINPENINPKVVNPNPKTETLGVFVLSCENLDCASFTCSIPEATISQVNVTFRVWKPTFIKGSFSSLYMLVNGTLGIRDTHLFELSSSDTARSAKIQVTKETLGGIPIWIIIISILIGLLILALVIFALWKMGFFKRKSRDFSKEDMMD
ncbi:Integrin alpha-1 [Larimichthys crocea]|nr:Integrin alpha-1 [Larimichthys crocea]